MRITSTMISFGLTDTRSLCSESIKQIEIWVSFSLGVNTIKDIHINGLQSNKMAYCSKFTSKRTDSGNLL